MRFRSERGWGRVWRGVWQTWGDNSSISGAKYRVPSTSNENNKQQLRWDVDLREGGEECDVARDKHGVTSAASREQSEITDHQC